MPATVMFTAVKTTTRYGKARRNFVTLPLVPSLLDEPGLTAGGRKYLELPDEPEPEARPSAAPEPERRAPLLATAVPDEFRALKVTHRNWKELRKPLLARARQIRRQQTG